MGPNLTFNTVYTLNILLNYVNIEHMGKNYVLPRVVSHLPRWKTVNSYGITQENELCILFCCIVYVITVTSHVSPGRLNTHGKTGLATCHFPVLLPHTGPQ